MAHFVALRARARARASRVLALFCSFSFSLESPKPIEDISFRLLHSVLSVQTFLLIFRFEMRSDASFQPLYYYYLSFACIDGQKISRGTETRVSQRIEHRNGISNVNLLSKRRRYRKRDRENDTHESTVEVRSRLIHERQNEMKIYFCVHFLLNARASHQEMDFVVNS